MTMGTNTGTNTAKNSLGDSTKEAILTDDGMRALPCSSCGAVLECGARAKSCWCQAYASLPAAALKPDQDCLCQACLMRRHIDHKLDQKTMPRGAMGIVGELAKQIAVIQKTLTPQLDRSAIVVFAADHGVSEEGVSAYPREVTWQMVENFRGGGAAINVLSRSEGIELFVVDAGVDHDFVLNFAGEASAEESRFFSRKVGRGTANFAKGLAMTQAQAEACLAHGRAIAREVIKLTQCQAMGFGEMGIANTTSAAALSCKLLGLSVMDMVGRGTGIDDTALSKKQAVVNQALALHAQADNGLEVLSALGGFEIGQMAGAMLEAAQLGQVLVIDGFISTSALLVARAMEPQVMGACVFAHQSEEKGHRLVLEALGVKPLLSLGLRLGEGSGAALAMPLLKGAANLLSEMASFESAGVAQT